MSKTSNYTNILAAIKTELESVSNIGKVYDYERWAVNVEDIRTMFKDSTSGALKAWTITRTATPENEVSSGGHERIYTFTIRGYMALDDSAATEKTFQGLVESICNSFRLERTLGNVCLFNKPVQVQRVEGVIFCGALCHHAELTINVHEILENY